MFSENEVWVPNLRIIRKFGVSNTIRPRSGSKTSKIIRKCWVSYTKLVCRHDMCCVCRRDICCVCSRDICSADKASAVCQDIPSSLPTQGRPRSRHNRCLACRQVWCWKPQLCELFLRFWTQTWDAWCWKPIFREHVPKTLIFHGLGADRRSQADQAEMVHGRQLGP